MATPIPVMAARRRMIGQHEAPHSHRYCVRLRHVDWVGHAVPRGASTATAGRHDGGFHRRREINAPPFKDGQALRTYRVALGRGGPEPKVREGDARTPEGTYFIDHRNPHSCCHLALHISYPNTADVAAARTRGVSAGSDIEIHGLRRGLGWLGRFHRAMDWTHGCIAVTDSEMDEIWHAVPDGTPIVIKH